MQRLSLEGFKLNANQTEIVHSSKLVLVDRASFVRGYFDGETEEGRRALLSAARAVLAEAPPKG